MNDTLTNLLPSGRQQALFREYFLRLSVVFIALVTALTLVAAMLLLPTYIFLTQSAATKASRLTNIESVLASSDEKILSAHLASLSNNAIVLLALGKAPSASAILRSALAIPRNGISLSGFAYTPSAGNVPGSLSISGTAQTREALRSYQLALESTPFAASADLPVSSYAKDTNIAFTITVTLTP